ncbi:hypothetical protein [Mangrovimonas xylaniphaga]|uniref:hypothetical protein n=1 Tax=Mangrovimonas xylaniphaga TaxID=1645915 RepID=UPI0006B5033C|nr:hypothetical protein [Mangrovimonas xylaniphaga]
MRYRILIIVVFLVVIIYTLFSLSTNISKIQVVQEPKYLNELFVDKQRIHHYKTEVMFEKTDTISIYNVDNFNYGIFAVRKKAKEIPLTELINVTNNKATKLSGFSKGSIFNNHLSYKFGEVKQLDRIKINGISENIIGEKIFNDSLIFFSLNPKSSVSINFNENKVVYLNNSDAKKNNQILILKENNYIYLIIAKPINSSTKNTFNLLDCINLKSKQTNHNTVYNSLLPIFLAENPRNFANLVS